LKTLRIILLLAAAAGMYSAYGQGYSVQPSSVNSTYSEYAPAYFEGGIIFCSDRKGEVLKTIVDSNEKFLSNIYFVPIDESGKEGKPRIFSDQLATAVNEGPVSFSPNADTLYFSANVSEKISSKKNNHLGIWMSVLTTEKWSVPELVEFCRRQSDFDVAHPALSPDGQMMVFSSNEAGGEGKSDLYAIRHSHSGWGSSENLGQQINTSGNELFPFIDSKNRLYFSSNGRNKSKSDLDIYFTELDDQGNWRTPVKLAEPLNSSFDDFGIVVDDAGERGYLSSNREKGNDNIYRFAYEYPTFNNCEEISTPATCYLIEEERIVKSDTLPLIYEWDFDDGTTARGLSAEHCFPGVGEYDVALNLFDTITGMQYARVSNIYVVIDPVLLPFITAPDTISVGESFTLSSAESTLGDFDLEQFYWYLGDGTRLAANEATHSFDQEGTYRVVLGALSSPFGSVVSKTCAYKDIHVMVDAPSIAWAAVPDFIPLLARGPKSLAHGSKAMLQKKKYYVEFRESDEPLALNNPFFEKVQYEITERYVPTDSIYKYSVGEADELAKLFNIYKELIDSGYKQTLVREGVVMIFDEEVIRRGLYYPDSVRAAMRKEINKFADIHFASSSDRIEEESYKNLRYISSVLEAEPTLRLKISAYTDNVGTEEFNLELSQQRALAVVQFLSAQGIDLERLESIGHGNSTPVADNSDETGRALNRRVEFELLFEEVLR
jgi:outer membrane protein OmpA-like peptidoglycan-associated protein